jgi:hypothetical protein
MAMASCRTKSFCRRHLPDLKWETKVVPLRLCRRVQEADVALDRVDQVGRSFAARGKDARAVGRMIEWVLHRKVDAAADKPQARGAGLPHGTLGHQGTLGHHGKQGADHGVLGDRGRELVLTQPDLSSMFLSLTPMATG